MQLLVSVMFILLFVPHSWATSSALGLITACHVQCNAEVKANYLNQISNQCEIENKILKCDELQKDAKAEDLGMFRRCEVSSLCKQADENLAGDQIEACAIGYTASLIATGIALKNTVVGLGEQIEQAWETVKKNEKIRSEYLTQCNQSLQCKRDLVKGDRNYGSMSDEELNKISATTLFVAVQEQKSYLQSLQRSADNAKLPDTTPAKDSELTESQQAKLMDLAAIMKAKLQKEYRQFNCYTPKAQVQMACYAIGQVVDPLLLAGAAFKAVRALRGASEISKEYTEFRAASDAREAYFATPRGKFVRKYLSYNPTTKEENAKWIELAKQGKSDGTYFVSVENSQMKYLNDTLKDKNVVTSLTNYHKKLTVSKLEELMKEYPDLKLTMSSDFKTLNIAGKIPPDLQKKISQMFADINTDFTAYLKDRKIIRDSDTPEKYFSGAIGTSADEANVVMRASRDMKPGTLARFDDPDVRNVISGSLRTSEIEREALQKQFGHTEMFDGAAPSAETFDILRKNKDPQDLKNALQTRYKTQVSDNEVASLQRYMNNVDTFSLNSYNATRELANLNNASFGGFSADFVGLGSQNLRETANALAKSKNVDEALLNARKGEQSVTVELNKQKEFLKKIISESVEPGKLKSVCSGDDCVAVAKSPLNDIEKQKILDRVAGSKYSAKLRFSFVKDGIKTPDARNTLSTHGESLEKLLRKNLSSQLSSKKLDGLTFGVDMRTTELNQGPVKLLVGQGQDLYLTKAERARIQNVFKETVEQFNKSITTKNKPAARYEASP